MEERKASQGTYIQIDAEQFLYLLRQWTKKLKHGDSSDVYFDLRIIKQVLKGENSFDDSTEELRALFNESEQY